MHADSARAGLLGGPAAPVCRLPGASAASRHGGRALRTDCMPPCEAWGWSKESEGLGPGAAHPQHGQVPPLQAAARAERDDCIGRLAAAQPRRAAAASNRPAGYLLRPSAVCGFAFR